MDRIFSIKHQRFLGIHNPFGSKIGKAADPYISSNTVRKLLNDPQARDVALENALNRRIIFKRDARLFKSILEGEFDKSVKEKVIDVFVKNLSPDNVDLLSGTVFESNIDKNLRMKFMECVLTSNDKRIWGSVYQENFFRVLEKQPKPILQEIHDVWTRFHSAGLVSPSLAELVHNVGSCKLTNRLTVICELSDYLGYPTSYPKAKGDYESPQAYKIDNYLFVLERTRKA